MLLCGVEDVGSAGTLRTCAISVRASGVCVPSLVQARDCAVTRESRSVWRRVLGHNATLRNPRDLAACMLQVPAAGSLGKKISQPPVLSNFIALCQCELLSLHRLVCCVVTSLALLRLRFGEGWLCGPQHRTIRVAQVEVEAVRPDPASPAEELRLRVALLPVRVRADQRVCEFLAAFFAPPDDMVLVPAAPVVPPPDARANNHEVRPAAEDNGRDAEGAPRAALRMLWLSAQP